MKGKDDDAQRGTYDVVDIRSTADTFELKLGEFVPPSAITEAKLSDILREHGAFSEGLLSELVKFVEAERQDEYEATMDARDRDWEYE